MFYWLPVSTFFLWYTCNLTLSRTSFSVWMYKMITNKLVLVNYLFLYKFASWCFQGDVCKLSAEFSWISCSETWPCPTEEGPLLPWKSTYLSSEKTTRQRFSIWLQPNFIVVRSKTSLVILGNIINHHCHRHHHCHHYHYHHHHH